MVSDLGYFQEFGERLFMENTRWVALALLLLFAGYTIYASRTESFWKSLKTVLSLMWGRQVTMDLYLGIFLFHFFVYL
jgi:hypothetical protein